MRQLFVNDNLADLSENTAIGITYQSGDISDPCKNKLTITNSFSLPLTGNNKRIFEFADSPFASTNLPYDKLVIDYFDGNIPLIKKSVAFLNNAENNYNLTVVKGGDIIEALKNNEIRDWLNYFLYPEISDLTNGIGNSTNPTESGVYDELMGNIQPPVEYEPFKPISATIGGGANTLGVIGITIKSIFEFLNTYGFRNGLGINQYAFTFNGTTSQITEFEKLVITWHDLIIQETSQGSGVWCLKINPTGIIWDLSWYGKKSLFDLVKSVCNIFNAIIEIDELELTIKLTTFNKILESTNIKDWSNKIISGAKKTKSFAIGGWVQNNYINYKYDDGVNINGGLVTVECNNTNIESKKEIDNGLFIPRAHDVSGDTFYLLGTPDIATYPLYTQKGIEQLVIFYLDGETTSVSPVNIYQVSGYGFTNNYSGMRSVLQNPITYQIEVNINLLDIYTFTNETLVKIDQLGGVFYVNKINGFNSKIKKGTQIELIKVR